MGDSSARLHRRAYAYLLLARVRPVKAMDTKKMHGDQDAAMIALLFSAR